MFMAEKFCFVEIQLHLVRRRLFLNCDHARLKVGERALAESALNSKEWNYNCPITVTTKTV